MSNILYALIPLLIIALIIGNVAAGLVAGGITKIIIGR